jgi:hypothetical protein
VIIFFLGYFNINANLIGLTESPVPVSKEVMNFWEWLTWLVFAVLAVDLYLKYDDIRRPGEFLRKYWLDIFVLALLPLFAGFIVANIAVKVIKVAKLAKSGLKASLGARKLHKAGLR